jgi:aspartyl-tRNA(Asn)/glutamyl-tRNA(Gln) amidotransferase subunit C
MLTGLNNFFAIVEQMREVNTDGVVPMAHPIDAMPLADLAAYAPSATDGMALRLRDDVVSGAYPEPGHQVAMPPDELDAFLDGLS